jgi:5-methylcytosine-specific restriction protein A
MPIAPKKPCRKPGCPKLTRDGSGYCEDHQIAATRRETATAKRYDKRRDPKVKMWLNSGRYKQNRKAFLEKNPLCIECRKKGKTKRANVLDHRTPHKGNAVLFWDQSNWDALCDSCHSVKTNKFEGGFGNKVKE